MLKRKRINIPNIPVSNEEKKITNIKQKTIKPEKELNKKEEIKEVLTNLLNTKLSEFEVKYF